MSSKAVVKYTTFKEFYPFYLSEHIHPTNRLLHFIGTSCGLCLLAYLLLSGNYRIFFLAFLPGYALYVTLFWVLLQQF